MARASVVKLGNGTTVFHRQLNASGVPIGSYVRIPSAKKIDPPAADREEIDTSDLDSEGDVKEYELGDSDPGESTLEIHFNTKNAIHREIYEACQTGTTGYQFKVVYADGDFEEWKGRYKSMSRSLERNSPIVGQVTIRNTGLAALTSV
jgi:hypothetical protein